MKTLMAMAILVAATAAAEATVTRADLEKLAKAGISEAVILAHIQAHGPVEPLSCDDILRLKAAGLGDAVLVKAMAAPPKPAAAVTPSIVILTLPAAPITAFNGAGSNVFDRDDRPSAYLGDAPEPDMNPPAVGATMAGANLAGLALNLAVAPRIGLGPNLAGLSRAATSLRHAGQAWRAIGRSIPHTLRLRRAIGVGFLRLIRR